MKTLNAVVLAAALFLTATAAAAYPAALLLTATPAPAGTTAVHVGALSETAAPEQGRRRRAGRPNPRREQPAAAAPAEAPAPAQTTPAPAHPRPAPPPGLCNPDWHRSARGSTVTRTVANGADVNQACGSGSSPLLLALGYGRAELANQPQHLGPRRVDALRDRRVRSLVLRVERPHLAPEITDVLLGLRVESLHLAPEITDEIPGLRVRRLVALPRCPPLRVPDAADRDDQRGETDHDGHVFHRSSLPLLVRQRQSPIATR